MNLNNVDLNKLAVFTQIVEAGNLRRASEALNVTPSALSQTIATLEHTLGLQLFHRVGKRLVLTEQGAEIQKEFKSHHIALLASLARISGKSREVGGLLRVGAYLEFARSQLAPILSTFQGRYPEVQVKFVYSDPTLSTSRGGQTRYLLFDLSREPKPNRTVKADLRRRARPRRSARNAQRTSNVRGSHLRADGRILLQSPTDETLAFD